MACFSLILKLTHLILVLLVVTISAFSDQDAVTYTIRGYVRDFLNPRPNQTLVTDTFNITKTPNPYSKRVAIWDVSLAPQLGGPNGTRAFLLVSITQMEASYCSGDYGNNRNTMLQPVLAEGVLDSRNQVDRLVVLTSGTEVATGAVNLFRNDLFLEVKIDVCVRYAS